MQIFSKNVVAILAIAAFSCLFCGSRLLPPSIANSSLKKAKTPNSDPIEKALDGMATFDFVDTPLKNVIEQIAADHRIPIKIDKVAIEDAGFDEDLPITGRGHGHPLRNALRILFMDYDFVAVITNNILLITTHEAITSNPENYLTTELYDVTDLQGFGAEQLILVIQDAINPESWLETNGGPGTITELVSEKKIILVISHTSDTHHRINELLDKIRKIENSN